MKLEELRLTITRLEEALDKDGNTYLKAKGYHTYKTEIKGRKINAFNFFTNIRLYPINELQLEETKNRLFSSTEEKPKLKIIAYQCDLATPLTNGRIFCNLTVNRFDFTEKKLFRKNTLLNYKGE
jgi:hypothetical protein